MMIIHLISGGLESVANALFIELLVHHHIGGLEIF
jgi:hypothetical protein